MISGIAGFDCSLFGGREAAVALAHSISSSVSADVATLLVKDAFKPSNSRMRAWRANRSFWIVAVGLLAVDPVDRFCGGLVAVDGRFTSESVR